MTTLSELLLAPGVFSLGAAAVLGAAHALTPGHSKTAVAAYLAGTRGTPMDALRLGTIVTFTHTASVFVLGLLAYYLTETIDLKTIEPLFNKASGVLIAGIGGWLLYQRLRPGPPPAPTSGPVLPEHAHPHGMSLRALGVSGGIVPCPEALALLLLSLARGQSLYGMVLLLSFSIGLAAVLIGLGLAAVFVYPRVQRFPTLIATIPIMSALVLIVMGVAMLA